MKQKKVDIVDISKVTLTPDKSITTKVNVGNDNTDYVLSSVYFIGDQVINLSINNPNTSGTIDYSKYIDITDPEIDHLNADIFKYTKIKSSTYNSSNNTITLTLSPNIYTIYKTEGTEETSIDIKYTSLDKKYEYIVSIKFNITWVKSQHIEVGNTWYVSLDPNDNYQTYVYMKGAKTKTVDVYTKMEMESFPIDISLYDPKYMEFNLLGYSEHSSWGPNLAFDYPITKVTTNSKDPVELRHYGLLNCENWFYGKINITIEVDQSSDEGREYPYPDMSFELSYYDPETNIQLAVSYGGIDVVLSD